MYPRRPALLALCPALYAALRSARRDLMNPLFPSSRLLLIHKPCAEFVPALPALCLVLPPCHSTCAALTSDCPRHALGPDLYVLLFLPRCPQPWPLPCALSPLSCPYPTPPKNLNNSRLKTPSDSLRNSGRRRQSIYEPHREHPARLGPYAWRGT